MYQEDGMNVARKVFVTQYVSKLNYEVLNGYGEIVFLLDQEYLPEPAPTDMNDKLSDSMARKLLSSYVVGVDFIVMTGSAIPNMVTGVILSEMKSQTRHKILKWSNEHKSYQHFNIKL